MKKIEVTNEITKYLSTHPFQLTDLTGCTIRLDSYEKFISEFSLVKNVFNTEIPIYSKSAIKYLNEMSNFIDSCLEITTDLSNHISAYMTNRICNSTYDRRIIAKFVSPNNLQGGPERSVHALKQIYSELGEDALINYVELIKNPGNLSSYLSNEKKQTVAMHYILYATNHHSNNRLKRNKTAKTLYELTQDSITDRLKEITAEKNDYIEFMNNEKEQYSSWFENTITDTNQMLETKQIEYQNFLNECKKSFDDTDKTFSEKLKVARPAEFMMEKAKEYKVKSIIWAAATCLTAIILIVLLGFILDPNIEVKDTLITVQLFTGNLTIYSTIIIFAIITLIVFTLKLFVKMTISAKHLSEEYHQKYVLTYFYLSLVKDGKMTIEQGNSILATLFTKADTGLLKNDSSSELESVQKILTSMK